VLADMLPPLLPTNHCQLAGMHPPMDVRLSAVQGQKLPPFRRSVVNLSPSEFCFDLTRNDIIHKKMLEV
jgi:hypothetical protein